MNIDPTEFPRVLTIYLELSNYPILAPRIRSRMRQELFKRNVINPDTFEAEVREKAIQSQHREGLVDPFGEEAPDVWNERVAIIRDHLTDFYFAYNLPHDRFVELVRGMLSKRLEPDEVVLTFHPELAPWDMLFAQGEAYEALPESERYKVAHHLQEIKVVLIKAMISDHLDYVGIAREWFDISDLTDIRSRRIGRGKIGGKAAGLMLAEAILRKAAQKELRERITIPPSWFLGADVFYQYTQLNELVEFVNQKYKSEEEIRADYPYVRQRYVCGAFPDNIIEDLRGIIQMVGDKPLIVRSSSLLEDSFGSSFAGKYESVFCPNQDTPENNLEELINAINRVYASVYNADVIIYRRRMGLIDYDERMGILIQEVQGRRYGRYFYPDAAGVAFSRNQYRWSPRIDREAGFMRLVHGLGTRAVDQFGDDYPRFVALSHPTLFPESRPKHIRRYSQHHLDVIDLKANLVQTVAVAEHLGARTPNLRYLAQRYKDDHLVNLVSVPLDLDPRELVITFDSMLRHTDCAEVVRSMLELLESAYRRPVDTEFVVELVSEGNETPAAKVRLVQCRPQSHQDSKAFALPKNVPPERRLFVTHRLIPDGRVADIRFAVYVREMFGREKADRRRRVELARLIGRLNQRLSEETFFLLAPGRWGSVNPELGIPVTYSDIFNSRALVEIVSSDTAPEPSYGTHFFQDLVEANIYTLALALQDTDAEFNRHIFEETPNQLAALLPEDAAWQDTVRVIDLELFFGTCAELVMNGEEGMAIAYLKEDQSLLRETTTKAD